MPSVRSGMSTGILLMLVLSALLMVWSASKADAQAETACQVELATLDSAILAAPLNDRDQQNLLTELQNARDKLGEGKTDDDVAKITDIRTAAEKKLEAKDAQAIVAAADAAIACLGASSGV